MESVVGGMRGTYETMNIIAQNMRTRAVYNMCTRRYNNVIS